jgi:hypothetical protein
MAKIIMIGVSTAQNTTNVLPALQMDIDYYISLETSLAHSNNWSDGMNNVLLKRKIKILPPIVLTPEEDSRIDLIKDKLFKFFQDDVEVLWNLGGGQKAQQIAMWQTFMERAQMGKDEIACYANPVNKMLEIWEYNLSDKKIEFYDDKLNSDLNAKEIFEIFGFDLEVNNDSIFYNSKLKYLYRSK